MANKIPTTEVFIQEYLGASNEFMESMREQIDECSGFNWDNITDFMIEFTRLHVEACQSQICHQMDLQLNESQDAQEIVMNAYPLENIK